MYTRRKNDLSLKTKIDNMSVFVVSIDGTDFSGKTTIANLVVELLRQMNKGKNIEFKRTEVPSRFITGAFTSILRSSVDSVPPEVFALAYAADHLFHYYHSIRPLEKHEGSFVIIQERSMLTTYVYQGLLGNVDFAWLRGINKFNKNVPKLTLILKVPFEELKKRKSLDRRQFDKFEGEDHIKKQSEVYYNLPEGLVKEFNIEYIDAGDSPLNVAERCANRIQREIEHL